MFASVLIEPVKAEGFGGDHMVGMCRYPASLIAAMMAARMVARLTGPLRFVVGDQPVQVRPHGMECIEGHHGAGQVRRSQQLGEWPVWLCVTSTWR
jgi:hypothetical protein